MKKRHYLKISVGLLVFLIICVSSFFIFDFTTAAKLGERSLSIDQTLTQEVKKGYTIYTPPTSIQNHKGIILYGGAKIPAKSYNYIAQYFTAKGYTVFYSDFFLHYAFFDIDLARKIIAENETITEFALSGHSLGGAMIGKLMSQNAHPKITKLIFLASYSVDDLSKLTLPVLSLSASNDGNSTPKKVKEYAHNLPPTAQFIEINGGNHRQFADYEFQKDDKPATIAQETQHTMILKAMDTFLET